MVCREKRIFKESMFYLSWSNFFDISQWVITWVIIRINNCNIQSSLSLSGMRLLLCIILFGNFDFLWWNQSIVKQTVFEDLSKKSITDFAYLVKLNRVYYQFFDYVYIINFGARWNVFGLLQRLLLSIKFSSKLGFPLLKYCECDFQKGFKLSFL